jgi:PHD/YefM family antitoxin component YafN of YafNO toxin-antitoxin module
LGMASIGIRPKFVTDKDGREVVYLSLAQWKKVEKRLSVDEVKKRIKRDLKEGMIEMREIEAGRIKPVSLQEFLREL